MSASVTAALDAPLLAGVVALVADEEAYERLRAAGRSCHFCAEPVRLTGRSVSVDAETGEILESFSSATQPSGELLKPCGTRRASRCAACAEVYKGDARQLVRAGLLGGKGVDASVSSHPTVFATLTAPSFGTVHRRPNSGGPCQAKGAGRCPHGRPLFCLTHHDEHDAILGEALCRECYDYDQAVLFNATVSELWRRTTIYAKRQLARLAHLSPEELDTTVRLSYIKVAEFQRRGVVHLHVLCRLDGADGAAPPGDFSPSLLALALRIAVGRVRAPYPDDRGGARWGGQFDCRVLDATTRATRRVANYLAKYATKGSDDDGALDRRLRSEADLARRALSPHLRQMAETAWRLGEDEGLARLHLRNWAHTLGLRSHFLTKSRRYSTTFTALRRARQAHRRAEHLARDGVALPRCGDLVVLGEWSYAGSGWPSHAEAFLITQEAERAATARRLAYEEDLLRQPHVAPVVSA
jgi:hypothetical protein